MTRALLVYTQQNAASSSTWVQGFALALGGPGLFLIAFLDSSFLSFPEVVDLLIVWLTIAAPGADALLRAARDARVGGRLLRALPGRRKGGEAFLRKRFTSATSSARSAIVPQVRPAGGRSSRRSCRRPSRSRSSCSPPASRGSGLSTFSSRSRSAAGIRYFGEGLLALWYGERGRGIPAATTRSRSRSALAAAALVLGVGWMLWQSGAAAPATLAGGIDELRQKPRIISRLWPRQRR